MVSKKQPKKVEAIKIPKEPVLKFKSFAILFFQDSIQNVNEEMKHLKSMRKHHMDVLKKLLPLKEEDVIKHFSDIPEMMQAYQDLLKEQE